MWRPAVNRKPAGTDPGNVARSRQFVLSRIDARNGALGLVPDSLDAAVVSSDFPVFNMNEDRLVPEFLGLYAKRRSFAEEARRVSEGTTNRVRLKEDGFYRLTIPLPPLPEQKRIVAKHSRRVAPGYRISGHWPGEIASKAQCLTVRGNSGRGREWRASLEGLRQRRNIRQPGAQPLDEKSRHNPSGLKARHSSTGGNASVNGNNAI